jgi:hypothetical protein
MEVFPTVFLTYRVLTGLLLAVFLAVLLAVVTPCSWAQTATIARLPTTTRPEILARARKFAMHTWSCGAANLHASCSKNYTSDWKPGQLVTGVPYNWGGFDSPDAFDRKIAKGLAAGAHSRNGVLSCTAGIDCSGFVSYCWGIPLTTHLYGTTNLREIAGKPKSNWFTDLKPGDALNKAGSHVVLFTGYNPDGTINICEASGSAARVICHKTTWSRFKGYIPLQYKGLDE